MSEATISEELQKNGASCYQVHQAAIRKAVDSNSPRILPTRRREETGRMIPGAKRHVPSSDEQLSADINDAIELLNKYISHIKVRKADTVAAISNPTQELPSTGPIEFVVEKLSDLVTGLQDTQDQLSNTRNYNSSNIDFFDPSQEVAPSKTFKSPALNESDADDIHPRVLLVAGDTNLSALLVNAARVDIASVVYEPSGTSAAAILNRIDRILHGRKARSIGFIVTNCSDGPLPFLQKFSDVANELRSKFWMSLQDFIIAGKKGGCMHFFSDNLACSVEGTAALAEIETICELPVSATSLSSLSQDISGGASQVTVSAGHIRGMYFNQTRLLLWSFLRDFSMDAFNAVSKLVAPVVARAPTEIAHHIQGELLSRVFYGQWNKGIDTLATAITLALQHVHSQNKDNTDTNLPPSFLLLDSFTTYLQSVVRDMEQQDDGSFVDNHQKMTTWHANLVSDLDPSFSWVDTDQLMKDANADGNQINGQAIRVQRQRILMELSRSEMSYSEMLRISQELYSEPLKQFIIQQRSHHEDVSTEIIPTLSHHKMMFSDISRLYFLHSQFNNALHKELNEDRDPDVGEMFIQFAERLYECYSFYIDSFETAVSILEGRSLKSQWFRAFLTATQARTESRGRSLLDIFVAPITRWRTYIHLFNRLLAVTPEGHPDGKSLIRCISVFEKCETLLNTVLHRKMEQETDETVLDNVKNLPEDVEFKNGKLLYHKTFTQIVLVSQQDEDRKQKKWSQTRHISEYDDDRAEPEFDYVQEVVLYVFTNSVMLCNLHETTSNFGLERKTEHHYLCIVPLSSVRARLMQEHAPMLYLVRLSLEGTSFILKGKSQEEVLQCIEAIRTAMDPNSSQ
eukprot:m.164932 g.164932  ORF g.164932 m.164932 type:complete len:856 (+) comp15249_c0_seq6:709-3276(+)